MAQVQRSGRSEVLVEAPRDALWCVVSDVTRTGEWSHEVHDVHWVHGAAAAVPGARFRGRNRAGIWRWARLCEVVAVEAPSELTWRTVPTRLFPDSTVWRIRLEPSGGQTRIVQDFEVVRVPTLLEPVYAALIPTHRDRTASLVADLRRLGDVAADGAAAPRPPTAPAAPDRRLTRLGNRVGVWLYRRSDGRLASAGGGSTVLLLTVPGRRSGLPRSTCVRFLAHDDGWVVWGTASGAPRDPDWFENLRRAGGAIVQIGGTTRAVSARELVGPERDLVWHDVVLARVPQVARYARRAGRTIPVARLDPL